MSEVVILNASYERLGGTSVRHAISMVLRQVAVIEEAVAGERVGPFPKPKVLRLVRYIATKWLYRDARYSREALLRRDQRTCAYCGGYASTVDHLVPLSRGGPNDWLNTVAACTGCNHRKASLTPAEAGLRLRWQPWVPRRMDVLPAA